MRPEDAQKQTLPSCNKMLSLPYTMYMNREETKEVWNEPSSLIGSTKWENSRPLWKNEHTDGSSWVNSPKYQGARFPQFLWLLGKASFVFLFKAESCFVLHKLKIWTNWNGMWITHAVMNFAFLSRSTSVGYECSTSKAGSVSWMCLHSYLLTIIIILTMVGGKELW